MSKGIDLEEYRKVAIDAASASAKVVGVYFNAEALMDVEEKSVDRSLVTAADKASGKVIREVISRNFPKHQILSEEGNENPYNFKRHSRFLWIVDEIDGTTNFSRGIPYFGISVGLDINGIPTVGAIALPRVVGYNGVKSVLEWDIVSGALGAGAFFNDKKLTTPKVARRLDDSVISIDYPYRHEIDLRNWMKNVYVELDPMVRDVHVRKSAVHCLVDVARGQYDVYAHTGLKPWDVAAAYPIIIEAGKDSGGRVTNYVGEDWRMKDRTLVAGFGEVYETILSLMKNHVPENLQNTGYS